VSLPLIAMVGGDPIVRYPVRLPGTLGMQDVIDYGNLVFKFALIMGVSSGAIAGAIVGTSAGRPSR
jgi:hypothetical protein